MAPQDDLEHYEATEAQDLTRLLRALRPPAREVQVPPPVDLAIRAAIWQAPVRRQLSTLLSMARRDLIQVIQQALTDNPLLEEGPHAADEPAPAGEAHAPWLTAPIDDLTDGAAWYDSLWQACVPDGWEAHGLPAQASEAPGAPEPPRGPPGAIVADVIVRKVGHDHQVCLNEGLPRLRLSTTYRRLVREGEAKPHLEDKLRAAVWLIRSLEHRHQALLKVATSLVTWQRDFLDHGLADLQPLALTEVADALGMHEATVSCVITNKYLATAHGIIALKDFFQRGLASAGGETQPSLTVKDTQQLIAVEAGPLIAEAERLANSAAPFDILIGESPKMQEVARLVERVLNTTAPVLLTGERGTGKDRLARLLHDQGPRAQGPFIAVNCAALPERLLEVELFGNGYWDFTGTFPPKPGRLELAAGGTLFLEEIGAMSPVLQGKLLRVLQENKFTRVRGLGTLTTDARIIAVTHQDLERLMAEGCFRRDLYHRLNAYPITLPPLRERLEDLHALTMLFLTRSSQKLRKDVAGISKEAMGWLERHPWPGNVRELEEVIAQAVARCQGPTVTAQDLPQALREHSRAAGSNDDAFRLPPGGIELRELEKDLIRQALEQAHQNKSQAAKLLGLSRTQLRTRMRLYGLE
jgi:DNA-binding NtrC family response regulator